MSGLNQFAAYFVASGDAFFVGAGLILLGRVTAWRFAQRRGARWLRLVTVLGVIFLVLSVTPLPSWLYGLCVALPLLSLNLPFRDNQLTRSVSEGERSPELRIESLEKRSPSLTLRVSRLLWQAQPLVELCLLSAVLFEMYERQQLYARPFAKIPTEVHVIGDSLSAGIAEEQNSLWPNLISRDWNVPVRNHAQPGADTKSAMRQAESVGDVCLVIIEIGGNDLLSGRDSRQVAIDLEQLIARLHSRQRRLIMFELPVPPISGAYDWARLQRRLARRYGMSLIPRREFAKSLLATGATTDGLHLSPTGHRAVADLLSQTLISRSSRERREP